MKTIRYLLALGTSMAWLSMGCKSNDNAEPPKTATIQSAAPTAPGSIAQAPKAETSTTGQVSAPSNSRPLYYEVPISDEDLKDRTLREFSLLRNTIYARAGNKFRRPWLHEYFSAQPWYKPLETMDESKISPLDRANARKIADADAALDQDELKRRRDALLTRKKEGKAVPEDAVELSLLSQRLGMWLGDSDTAKEGPSPLEDPKRLDQLLKVEELSTLSRRDLRILRNMIYARHGMLFQSAVVRDYFKAATWYKPNTGYHHGMLNSIDNKNIKLIRSVEDSLGGPLHENPDYGKDGWFVAA